jgi:hypothetical protein
LSLAAAQGKKLATPKPVTFAPATSISGTVTETGIASGDLTNNGVQDLVITDFLGGFFTALGNGDGTFQPFVIQGSVGLQNSVVVADINEDGKLDYLIPNGAQSTIGLFRGNGAGGSSGEELVHAGPLNNGFAVNAVAVGDLRKNGIADIVFTNGGAFGFGNDVGVLLGKGKGAFEHQVLYHPGGTEPNSVFITDLNGDGIPDLLVGNLGNCFGTKNTVGALLGKGDGTFQPAKATNVNGQCGAPGQASQSLITADFNGDHIPDIAVMVTGGVAIFLGKGDGTFMTPGKFYQVGCGSLGGLSADFNGDGIPDLALVGNCSTSYVSVLLGNGDGTFQPPSKFAVGSLPVWLTVADFNGDGKPDIATANYVSQDVSILLNTTP